MTDKHVQITAVGIDDEGSVEIAFVRVPDDVKSNGVLYQTTVAIPQGSDYDPLLEAFHEALTDLLNDVLWDRDITPAAELVQDDDELDDDELHDPTPPNMKEQQ